MNQQSILQYVQQPALLAKVGMEELLEMVRDYPYSPNLRLLVVLKAKQEHDPDFERYLNRYAAATFDRPHLFDLLESIKRTEEERGEVLELLELEELELAPLADPFEELPSRLNEIPPPTPAPPPPPSAPAYRAKTVIPEPDPTVTDDGTAAADWTDVAAAFHAVVAARPPRSEPVAAEVRTPPPHPEDPARFAAILERRRSKDNLRARLQHLRRLRESDGTAASSGGGAGDKVAVVSETLAALLVKQEQYRNAIKMYRRLILLYPEKKTIFAGLIKELKEKL
ncbi:hypothetical protein [Lewinella sp. JB7]|uniref:hypothetical protein n=1 Tax=Lewinella sp. JB7 TaxID=2962887 RepID=UPI0020C941A7|nr:hypothetical protein [Lewinella sp. JB7]MCP9234527.1 hypothetical protein [Lewinella sp. JB7]